MRVTALIENSKLGAREDVCPEFGLSMYVERDQTRVLFDMGASGAFVGNAVALGIDVADADVAVLSHQHFDHGGGLEHFLASNDRATVFLRDSPVADRFFKAFVVLKRSIGIDRSVLEGFDDRFERVSGTREIAPGIHVVTEIGSAHSRPAGNRHLFAVVDGDLVPDPFEHELLMVVCEEDGLVVFSGCSHNGILNMIDAATTRFPNRPVKAVFGGFHLIGLPFYNSMAASRSEVEEIARSILDRVSGTVYSGHCTGDKAFRVLEGVMGERLQRFQTGTVVEV